jgi:hypothetical protein
VVFYSKVVDIRRKMGYIFICRLALANEFAEARTRADGGGGANAGAGEIVYNYCLCVNFGKEQRRAAPGAG